MTTAAAAAAAAAVTTTSNTIVIIITSTTTVGLAIFVYQYNSKVLCIQFQTDIPSTMSFD